jgi:hypothetical protein
MGLNFLAFKFMLWLISAKFFFKEVLNLRHCLYVKPVAANYMRRQGIGMRPRVASRLSMKKVAIVTSLSASLLAGLVFLIQTIRQPQAVAGSGTVSIPPGSFIINMGITPQTIANGLKPYGMIYDLIKNYNVPIIWSINNSKNKDGIDFTIGSTNYRGGPFIISAPYITSAVSACIIYWQSQGVQGTFTTSSVVIPVYDTLTAFPHVIIDSLSSNQGIIIAYFNNAGISSSAYSLGRPADLTSCHDMWVNPHGDPVWSTHGYLYDFVTVNKSYIWSQCHAVSMLEGCYNGLSPSQRLNFLSSNGLRCYTSNECGTLITESHPKFATTPFTHAFHTHPVMQFMGSMAGATTNGSERWFQPQSTGSWYSTTYRGVTTANGTPPGEGTVLVFGPAFGNTANGWVMYQGGHDLNSSGTTAERVAAQRAFFNFCLLAARNKNVMIASFQIPASFQGGQALPVSVNVTSGAPPYSYQWTASLTGGYFGDPTASSTYYMAPTVFSTTQAIITCLVTDQCGRSNFVSMPITINPSPLPVSLMAFHAEVNAKNEVLLRWSTASEKNNDFFTIERSASTNGFKAIGKVKGAGTTSQITHYSFVDKQPLPGTSYYRLKQTDFNGSFELFQPVEVRVNKFDQPARLHLYPNPFSESLTVTFQAEKEGQYQIQFLMTDGRLLKNEQVDAYEGENKVTLDHLNLPAGRYIIRVLNEETIAGSTVAICKR